MFNSILQSTLDNYSAKEIKSRAKLVGVDIDVKDKKIIIPNDKEKNKIILGFLDEEAYKGPFSQKLFWLILRDKYIKKSM